MFLGIQSLLAAYSAVFREICSSFPHPPCISVRLPLLTQEEATMRFFQEAAVGCGFGRHATPMALVAFALLQGFP